MVEAQAGASSGRSSRCRAYPGTHERARRAFGAARAFPIRERYLLGLSDPLKERSQATLRTERGRTSGVPRGDRCGLRLSDCQLGPPGGPGAPFGPMARLGPVRKVAIRLAPVKRRRSVEPQGFSRIFAGRGRLGPREISARVTKKPRTRVTPSSPGEPRA